MSRPDEGMIHQWLDGECTAEESAEIERLIATDAEWAAAVAEARGLIAASSRIVDALDAVPRAMPTGSRAAPTVRKIPAWMKVAAAVVVVAGTAYALRDRAAEPFLPTPTTVDGVVAPQPTMSAPASPVPPSAVASPAAAPVVAPPPPVAQAEASGAARAPVRSSPHALEITRAEDAASTRRARMAADAPRGAIARAQEMAPTAAPAPERTLEGCWRVSAPPELLGVLNAPVIRREAGDTLVLVTARGDVTVVRAGDELRGGLQAKREACGAVF